MSFRTTGVRVVALLWIAAASAAAAPARHSTATRLLPPLSTRDVVYAALGDSTVEGIGASSPETTYPSRIAARLRALYPDARLENLGVAGAVASGVVADQLDRAVALRPALVTLSVGPNDVTGGVPAAEYARNVEIILRALHDRTSAVVVVNLLPDLASTPRFAGSPRRDEVGRRAVELNRILATAAKRWDAELIDLHGRSRDELPGHPELIAGDGYHPSDAGYARWAELMWEGVARRMPRATAKSGRVDAALSREPQRDRVDAVLEP
jgi:lysophospholipase L1-like esterase